MKNGGAPAQRETRRFEYRNYRSEMGRSTVIITCPYCGSETVAFLWSLAGSGKRCSGCGCVHHWNNHASVRYIKGEA